MYHTANGKQAERAAVKIDGCKQKFSAAFFKRWEK